jgi:hypothetical protein
VLEGGFLPMVGVDGSMDYLGQKEVRKRGLGEEFGIKLFPTTFANRS